MNKLIKPVLLIQLCNLFIPDLFSQYPFENANIQHFINGTVGEERGGRTRYHYGIDFQKPGGTHVHAIEGGILKLVSGYPAISHFGYLHVINLKYRLNEFVPAGAYIGDVSYSDRHLHLQQNSENLSSGPPNSWDGNGWLNPISYLDPDDQSAPRIEFARIYSDNNHVNNITNQQIIYGKLDLIVNSEDQRINADGTGGGFGIAPFKMDCELLNKFDQNIYSFPGISFESVPTNNSAFIVHGPNADYNTPNFEYWITHDPFLKKYDRYFNIRQKLNSNYSESGNCPDQCQFKDGEVKLRITSKDFSNNSTQFVLPNANFHQYIIDNFQPYIESVTVLIDGINVYSASWECGNNGPEFSGYECRSTDVMLNSLITIKVTTSEFLSFLNGRIVEFPGGFISFNNTGGLNWEATFQNLNYLKDGDKGHLLFAGSDMNGNHLLDMRAIAGGKIASKQPVLIPIRESSTTWKPIRKGGDYDDVHEFCFRKCHNMKDDGERNEFATFDCIQSEDLNLSYEFESFNGAGDAWIHLDVSGGFPPYYIKWADNEGKIIKQGLNAYDLTDLTAGTYCYFIEDAHCCGINSCVTLCPAIALNVITGLTPPSDCNLNDGKIRIISTKTNGGKDPYNYNLLDIHGDHFQPDPVSGIYENLYAGKYFYTATDANGCSGSFKIELNSPEKFFLFPEIVNSCKGNDGKIKLYALSEDYPDDTYRFEWSTGLNEDDITESGIDQLTAGIYCVTVTSNSTDCNQEDCYEIKGTGKALSLNYESLIPCQNQQNGAVQLSVSGGNKPYSYKWSNGDFRSGIGHLSTGQYCVTITDGCQNSIKQCFDLNQSLRINLVMVYNCPDNVNVLSEVSGGNPEYSYKWSNGYTIKNLIGVPIGGIYKVTVTDKLGCTAVNEINTNPVELINPVKPCKGFWDGQMTFKINNPRNERVDVSYDYSPCDDCGTLYKIRNDYSNPVSFTLKDLAGSKQYHFYVRVGQCLFEVKFTLGEEELSKEFKRFEESNGIAACVYDLVCNENRIVDGKREVPILTHTGGNCKKFLFKECAEVEVKCDGNPGVVKTIPGKKIHMRRLELILYAQELGLDASSLTGNFCDHVWICHDDPYCIVATARGELGGKFKGIERDGDCYRVKCRSFFGLIRQDYKICGENFIPDAFLPFYRDDRNYLDPTGKPKPKECTPITLNFTDVLECWSKFVMDDGKKFYDSEMAKLVDSYRNKRERYCGWVTFCLEDYSLVKTNILEIECLDFNPPLNVGNWVVNSTCDPHSYNGNDIVFCECDDPEIIRKNGICLEPKLLPKRCTVALQNTEEPRSIQFVPFQHGNTFFTGFSTLYQPEEFNTINAIFKDTEGKSYYQKFEPGIIFNQLEEFEGALYAHRDAKNNRIQLISNGNSPNEYEIYSGELNTIHFTSISCDQSLKFRSFYPFGNGFISEGEFKGAFKQDNKIIFQAADPAIFVLYRNDKLNLTEINFITGASNIKRTSGRTNCFVLKRSSALAAIQFNGVALDENKIGNIILMKINESGEIALNRFSDVDGRFELINYSESKDGSNLFILANANGPIQIGEFKLDLPFSNQLVLVRFENNNLKWYDYINSVGIDMQNIQVQLCDKQEIVIGLNVNDSSNLLQTNPDDVNRSGSDIVIIKYDSSGNRVFQQRYGSIYDDEVLKEMYYSEENVLYLGGEIKGASLIRSIGDVDLIKAGDIENSAFISYINFNASESVPSLRKQEVITNKRDRITILSLQPNPVNKRLRVDFQCQGNTKIEFEIFDLNGKRIEMDGVLQRNSIIMNTSALHPGMYLFKLRDESGNAAVRRFVKTD